MKRISICNYSLSHDRLDLFGILAICVRLFQTESATLAAIFWRCLCLLHCFIIKKKHMSYQNLNKLKLLNDQTEVSLKSY